MASKISILEDVLTARPRRSRYPGKAPSRHGRKTLPRDRPTAVRADIGSIKLVPALMDEGVGGSIIYPLLTPLSQRQQHRPQFLARSSQVVLKARRMLRILPLLNDTSALQLAQAHCQQVTSRTSVTDDLLKPVDTVVQLPDRQQRPPFTQHAQ